ncbi:MAG TPA: DUF1697 domain-containing protein [Candidatus Peribacteraceae bacterium]|nr:DUF1697 domain-containing protein [Candidatus Peribacteraceae bacterium]
MPTFIALLRGINVGGNKKVPMADLKKAMEKAGYTNVKTLLNSGNVVFDASEKKPEKVRTKLESVIEKKFGFPVPTLIRAQEEITALIALDPFKNISVNKDMRLYVTFLSEKPTSTVKIPYVSPDKSFTILRVTDHAIFSVLQLSEKFHTPDAMNVLEKEFGKNITTRNWNTIQKLVSP